MSFWAEVFLGVIALATFTMAAIQVGVLLYGVGVARRLNKLFSQVEREMKPLAESVNTIARDAARISSLAACSQWAGKAARCSRSAATLRDPPWMLAISQPIARNSATSCRFLGSSARSIREQSGARRRAIQWPVTLR